MPLEAGCSARSGSALLPALEAAAAGCGFSFAGEIDVGTLTVRPEVRDCCAAGKCGAYGKNWSCPPACGSLDECRQQIRRYSAAMVLQSTGRLEDSFDYEAMAELGVLHNRRLLDFHERLRALFAPQAAAGAAAPFLLLGSGGCKVCEPCPCPQSPCRFPAKMIVSMEAMGLLVSDVCAANGIPYYRGAGTLTYVACVLV